MLVPLLTIVVFSNHSINCLDNCARSGGGLLYEPEDPEEARRQESNSIGKYFPQLRQKAKVAGSVVHKCSLLNKQEHVLE
ncbi:hypothetical protein B0O99DRAFT_629478 [Bisporella sp. PMI_857]|nr:hypothetical protein B0O99DRAFT_629478 [Bisporella sp. PMI_857]